MEAWNPCLQEAWNPCLQEAWNPCLQEAYQLAAFISDIGVQIKVGEDAHGNAILKVRDPAKFLTPGLRATLQDVQEDVIALLSRYDQWRAGQPPPLRGAATWPQAVTNLIDWLGIRMGEEVGAEFLAECGAMRLVWDWRQGLGEKGRGL